MKYQYRVNEKSYVSSRIFFGDFFMDSFSRKAKDRVKKYSENKIIRVYYNPENLSDSVLELKFTFNMLFLLIIRVGLLLLGGFRNLIH